ALLSAARRGIGLLPGDADGFQSLIWIDDAARAVVAALAPRVPPGIYDVADDEPLRRRDVLDALARAVGRRRLARVPALAGRALAALRAALVLQRLPRPGPPLGGRRRPLQRASDARRG